MPGPDARRPAPGLRFPASDLCPAAHKKPGQRRLTDRVANDIRKPALPFMFALEFDDLGLCGVRQAGRGEFLQMLSATRSPVEEAREYLLSVGEGTASEIGEIIGKHRSEVSRMLNMDARFGKRKAGKHVFFSLRSDRESV